MYPVLFKGVITVLSKLKIWDREKVLSRKVQRIFYISFANTHGMFSFINCVSMCPYIQQTRNIWVLDAIKGFPWVQVVSIIFNLQHLRYKNQTFFLLSPVRIIFSTFLLCLFHMFRTKHLKYVLSGYRHTCHDI